MVFSSLEFLFLFLPLFLLIYYLLPMRGKNAFLFLGSLVFYGFGIEWNLYYLALIIVSVVLNFTAAAGIERCRRKNRIRNGEERPVMAGAGEKMILFSALCYNFGVLLFFKYAGLFIRNMIFPVGISFYTFQIASYLIDVYRGKIRAEQDMIRLGTYLTMFPQLIAGPIMTYGEARKRLRRRKITLAGCNHGLQFFTLGLGFKVLLANQLGNLWEDVRTIGFESISTPLAWLGILAYSLQIYFDFYGYSLMAAGLGKLLGFRIPDNFRLPYMSLSMTEFWRRWHITLGRWFRNYIYIPLGGNRKGKGRQFLNLLAVWLLTGLWHGTSWNFILWGLFLFAVVCVEKVGLLKALEKWRALGHLYMCFLIPFSWTLFAITDFGQLKVYLLKLFPFFAAGSAQAAVFAGDFEKYIAMYGAGLAVGLVCCTGLAEKIFIRWRNKFWMSLLLLLIFAASVFCMYRGLNDPFLYSRF